VITVWSVLWGDKYAPEYVYKLQKQVGRNLRREHRFLCVTDQDLPDITTIKPICDYPGWWQKIGLFKPGVATGLNLFLDLDVVIVKELDTMINQYQSAKLAASRRWHHQKAGIQSSVMLWNPCPGTDAIWQQFDETVLETHRGDQDWIQDVAGSWFTEIRLPDICSYKRHCRKPRLPLQNSRIVCFHGKPDPHECTEQWIQKAWQ
jgi:hypothetical protein